MADTAREISQEYWRPAQQPMRSDFTVAQGAESYCALCGTQFAPGARFCHVCGGGREPEYHHSAATRIAEALDFTNIRQRLGLSATSLVFVVVAAACVLAAILTGVVYGANTFAEWQAVQTWRIQWMIAAIVALVAAILFKDCASTRE